MQIQHKSLNIYLECNWLLSTLHNPVLYQDHFCVNVLYIVKLISIALQTQLEPLWQRPVPLVLGFTSETVAEIKRLSIYHIF